MNIQEIKSEISYCFRVNGPKLSRSVKRNAWKLVRGSGSPIRYVADASAYYLDPWPDPFRIALSSYAYSELYDRLIHVGILHILKKNRDPVKAPQMRYDLGAMESILHIDQPRSQYVVACMHPEANMVCYQAVGSLGVMFKGNRLRLIPGADFDYFYEWTNPRTPRILRTPLGKMTIRSPAY